MAVISKIGAIITTFGMVLTPGLLENAVILKFLRCFMVGSQSS